MKKLALTLAILLTHISLWAQDPWILEAEDIDPDHYYGITVSNGKIGLVSSPDPMKIKETVVAGLYDVYGSGRVESTLHSFNLLNMEMTIGWQDVNAGNISHFRQSLDMRDGSFTGSFDYKDLASVRYTYRALRHLPNMVLMDISVQAKKNTAFVARSVLKTPAAFRDNRNYYNDITPPKAYIPILTTVADSPSGTTKIAASTAFLFPDKRWEEPEVMHSMRDTDSHLMEFTRWMKEGEEYHFSVIGSLFSSKEVADPYNQAERMAIYGALQGHDDLIARHQTAWKELWQSDIVIEGDPQAQQDIHNMMYHLYSFTRKGGHDSLSPMGLSGLGYMGHVFWDTEIWMLPSLLMLHPEIAEDLLEYRFQRLDAAKMNAQMHGYKGAMFPWESAESGEEATPVWAITGPYEHHITADVAIAAWKTYLVTGDKEWLREKAWPTLQATAEFWASRVTEEDGIYHIKNVVCADEWAENVDDNAFTNAAAKLNLQYANAAAKVLGYEQNPHWNEIADRLAFHHSPEGVTLEYEGYDGRDIKQADVNLLAYPLGTITDRNQILRDLEYYQTRVPHSGTPAMTQAIFSLLYSRLGDGENAWKWFKDSYEPNLLPPFRVIAETKGGTNPYFITGAGGILQVVIMGFGGWDIQPKGGIGVIDSALPPHWKSVQIKTAGQR